MSIPEYARANFSTLLRAAVCADLALLDCAVTGEPRYVIWPLWRYRHNGHWTGAPGAAFTCASPGIVPTVRHTDYVGSCWTSCASRPAAASPAAIARPLTSGAAQIVLPPGNSLTRASP